MLVLYFLLWLLRWLPIWRLPQRIEKRRGHRPPAQRALETITVRSRRKPEWVTRELIRLKALSPQASCRTLAEVFNRQFGGRESVGKTFVATVLRHSHLEIVRLRRELKHRIPRPMPINRTWGLDLTGKSDLTGRQRMMLGLLDHGSRACLRLSALSDKRSGTVLRELIAAFRKFGLPQRLRVDNEACFNSVPMKAALAFLGIQLQTTALHCPWQNGRIERFFGTLKQQLDRIAVIDGDDLRCKLLEFRCWYNHVRPHQHLLGHTPAEVWDGRDKSVKPPRRFEAWDGALTGWFFPS